MQFFHSDEFTFPLPVGHTFPQNKYARLTRRVVDSGLAAWHGLRVPRGVTDAEIEHAHTPAYGRSFRTGQLGEREMRRIGLSWSIRLAERTRRSCGSTLDCDVHHGDGTAAIFATDETVTTFSIHGAKNYPFHKQHSDLDIEMPDGEVVLCHPNASAF
jgi:acetoin utilization deacetylase AcuC-like enzyme